MTDEVVVRARVVGMEGTFRTVHACAEHFCQIGPNGLEIEKETTHVIVRWTRVASMA